MRLFFCLFISLCVVQPAMAQSWFQRTFSRSVSQVSFTDAEKREISDYFYQKSLNRQHVEQDDDDDDGYGKKKNKENNKKKGKKHGKGKGLPPGLAKKETLPPGLAKQLEKNGTLPPGLAKRDLPEDLYSRLPRRTKNQDRVLVGDDIVLIERTTGRVLDIIRDVMTLSGRH